LPGLQNIVSPADATTEEAAAAAILKLEIDRVYGTNLTSGTDPGVSDAVFVGRSSSFQPVSQARDTYRIKADETNLHLAGADEPSLRYGSHDLLRRMGIYYIGNLYGATDPVGTSPLGNGELSVFDVTRQPKFELRYLDPWTKSSYRAGTINSLNGVMSFSSEFDLTDPAHPEYDLFDDKGWPAADHPAAYLYPTDTYYDANPGWYNVGVDKTTSFIRTIVDFVAAPVQTAIDRARVWFDGHATRWIAFMNQGDDKDCINPNAIAADLFPHDTSERNLTWCNAVAAGMAVSHDGYVLLNMHYFDRTHAPTSTPAANVCSCIAAWWWDFRISNEESFEDPINVFTGRIYFAHRLANLGGKLGSYEYSSWIHGMIKNIEYFDKLDLLYYFLNGTGSTLSAHGDMQTYVAAAMMDDPTDDPEALTALFCGIYYGASSQHLIDLYAAWATAIEKNKPKEDHRRDPTYLAAARASLTAARASLVARPDDERRRTWTGIVEEETYLLLYRQPHFADPISNRMDLANWVAEVIDWIGGWETAEPLYEAWYEPTWRAEFLNRLGWLGFDTSGFSDPPYNDARDAATAYLAVRSYDGSDDYHTLASSAETQFGAGDDFTVATWVHFTSVPSSGTVQLVGKGLPGLVATELSLGYEGGQGPIFTVSNGTAKADQINTVKGVLSPAVWYLLVGEHEAGVGLRTRVYEGPASQNLDSTAHTLGSHAGANPVTFGGAAGGGFLFGRMGRSLVAKKLLTEGELFHFWRDGAGANWMDIQPLTNSLNDANLVGFWEGNELSGSLKDHHGTLNAAAVSGPGSAEGPPAHVAPDAVETTDTFTVIGTWVPDSAPNGAITPTLSDAGGQVEGIWDFTTLATSLKNQVTISEGRGYVENLSLSYPNILGARYIDIDVECNADVPFVVFARFNDWIQWRYHLPAGRSTVRMDLWKYLKEATGEWIKHGHTLTGLAFELLPQNHCPMDPVKMYRAAVSTTFAIRGIRIANSQPTRTGCGLTHYRSAGYTGLSGGMLLGSRVVGEAVGYYTPTPDQGTNQYTPTHFMQRANEQRDGLDGGQKFRTPTQRQFAEHTIITEVTDLFYDAADASAAQANRIKDWIEARAPGATITITTNAPTRGDSGIFLGNTACLESTRIEQRELDFVGPTGLRVAAYMGSIAIAAANEARLDDAIDAYLLDHDDSLPEGLLHEKDYFEH
jgi:hypothetical protein